MSFAGSEQCGLRLANCVMGWVISMDDNLLAIFASFLLYEQN